MDESFSLSQTDNFNSFISDNELILILLCIVDITPFMGLTEVTTDTTDHIRSPYGSVPTVLSPHFAFELLGSFKRSQMWINIHFIVDKFTRLFYLLIQLVRAANYGRWCRLCRW